MQIYPPSPNADGVLFSGKRCYPPFPEETLENIPEQFSARLEQQGLIPLAETQPDSGAVRAEATEQQDIDPWTKISDHGWDRLAVQLLHEGYTSPEIARKTGKEITAKTVDNRLSQLRALYGTEIVPYRKQGPQKLG